MIWCHLFGEHSGSMDYNVIGHAPWPPEIHSWVLTLPKSFYLDSKRHVQGCLLYPTHNNQKPPKCSNEERHPYREGRLNETVH